jgi:hypothetical protein
MKTARLKFKRTDKFIRPSMEELRRGQNRCWSGTLAGLYSRHKLRVAKVQT